MKSEVCSDCKHYRPVHSFDGECRVETPEWTDETSQSGYFIVQFDALKCWAFERNVDETNGNAKEISGVHTG